MWGGNFFDRLRTLPCVHVPVFEHDRWSSLEFDVIAELFAFGSLEHVCALNVNGKVFQNSFDKLACCL